MCCRNRCGVNLKAKEEFCLHLLSGCKWQHLGPPLEFSHWSRLWQGGGRLYFQGTATDSALLGQNPRNPRNFFLGLDFQVLNGLCLCNHPFTHSFSIYTECLPPVYLPSAMRWACRGEWVEYSRSWQLSGLDTQGVCS